MGDGRRMWKRRGGDEGERICQREEVCLSSNDFLIASVSAPLFPVGLGFYLTAILGRQAGSQGGLCPLQRPPRSSADVLPFSERGVQASNDDGSAAPKADSKREEEQSDDVRRAKPNISSPTGNTVGWRRPWIADTDFQASNGPESPPWGHLF